MLWSSYGFLHVFTMVWLWFYYASPGFHCGFTMVLLMVFPDFARFYYGLTMVGLDSTNVNGLAYDF